MWEEKALRIHKKIQREHIPQNKVESSSEKSVNFAIPKGDMLTKGRHKNDSLKYLNEVRWKSVTSCNFLHYFIYKISQAVL